MKKTTKKARDKEVKDFAALIAVLWNMDYMKSPLGSLIKSRWINREVKEAAYEKRLFKGWLKKKPESLVWAGPEASRKFRKLCDRFNGSIIEHEDIFERVRFEVQGKGHERCYILRNESPFFTPPRTRAI